MKFKILYFIDPRIDEDRNIPKAYFMGMILQQQSNEDYSWLFSSYVAGQLGLAANALVESHLEITDENHAWVTALEGTVGQFINETPNSQTSWTPDGLEAIFNAPELSKNAIGDERDPGASVLSLLSRSDSDVYPSAISRIFGKDIQDNGWKQRFPGYSEVKANQSFGDARLLRIDPGRAMPHHTHDGVEMTLVLKGSFNDGFAEFKRGDICIADEHHDHKPIAGKDEECICFAVTEGTVRLSGLLGKIISPIIRY